MLYPLNKTIMPLKKKKTTEARRGKKNLGIILCICVDNSYVRAFCKVLEIQYYIYIIRKLRKCQNEEVINS